MSKRFRVAYVAEKGELNDIPALEEHADEIHYILTGTEQNEEIQEAIYESFSFVFDPDYDVIIPTGRTIVSFILGYFLGSITAFYIGIYKDKTYNFVRVGRRFE